MGRKKIDPLLKRIPFNKSIKRGVILAFEQVCEELEVSPNDITESLIVNFINDINESKRKPSKKDSNEPTIKINT